MAKSYFEELPDRMLFALTKKIYDNLEDVNDYGEIDGLIGEYGSIVGLTSISYEDTSYINEIIQYNMSDFENGELSGKLIRPTLTVFVIPYVVYETHTVRYDYETEVECYGSEPKDAIKIQNLIDENGDFDLYGTNAIYQETIDSELDEVKWQFNDIRKK
jgi:hypothetical protein